MAADLSGMFNQLNQAIGRAPVGAAQGLLDQTSQSFGGAMGNVSGRDPYSFMNQGARKLQGQQDLSQASMQTPEGLQQAAQALQQMGKPAEAMKMMQAAQELADRQKALKEATHAKEVGQLEAAQAGIQEEAARKKKRSTQVQALATASRNGDRDAIDGLRSGAISPEAYMTKLMAEKDPKNKTLADGAMLVGPEGEVLAHNPKNFSDAANGGDLTATMQKRLNASNDAYYENMAVASEMDQLMARLGDKDLSQGWNQSLESAINSSVGRRDEDDYLRTKFVGIKNGEAIKQLPKGPASDKDVAIVMKGFPPDNAGPEEIKQFLEAFGRVARKTAMYEKAKADHISEYGDERGFIQVWDRKAGEMAKQEYMDAVPVTAIAYLRENQNEPGVQAYFMSKFKVDPKEFLTDGT